MSIGATHDGPFHLDDVLAAAILRIVYGPGFAIIRSRKPEELLVADIV